MIEFCCSWQAAIDSAVSKSAISRAASRAGKKGDVLRAVGILDLMLAPGPVRNVTLVFPRRDRGYITSHARVVSALFGDRRLRCDAAWASIRRCFGQRVCRIGQDASELPAFGRSGVPELPRRHAGLIARHLSLAHSPGARLRNTRSYRLAWPVGARPTVLGGDEALRAGHPGSVPAATRVVFGRLRVAHLCRRAHGAWLRR